MAVEDNIQGVVIAVALDPDGPHIGLLLSGNSGIGKTSLALALCETCPYQRTAIVADDLVIVKRLNGKCIATAPHAIESLAEVRGFGPARIKSKKSVTLSFGVHLLPDRQPRVATVRQFSIADTGWEVPIINYAIEGYSWGDHAFRVRTILRSFLTGQMP